MRLNTCLAAACVCAVAVLPAGTARGLSLDEALARAARNRPELAVAHLEAAAGEGRLLQAGLRPGLEADLELRNAFEETSAGLSVVQELGGKREARVAAARAGLELLAAQAQVRRLDVGRDVRAAFFAALAAEQALALAEEALALARSFSQTVAEKVRAGAASPIEETRAAVRLHGASAEVEAARRDAAVARADLALAVADPAAQAEPLEGRIPPAAALFDAVAAGVADDAPDAQAAAREVLLRRSALEEERSRSRPDLTWRAAANHSRLDDEAWLTVGVSIPLAAASRNRGAVAAAAAEADLAEAERAAGERRRTGELQRARAALAAWAREAAILEADVLAGAERAVATVTEGYRLGKFPYLDVLDASGALLDARRRHGAALAAAAQAGVEVDRLLAKTTLPAVGSNR